MTDELKSPMRFKCPTCGHKETVLATLAQREIAEGLLPKDANVGTAVEPIFLCDTQALRGGKLGGKKIRQVISYKDICVKCGVEYRYLVLVKEVEVPKVSPTAPPIIYKAGPGEVPPMSLGGFGGGRGN